MTATARARTGFLTHPDCDRHDPGRGHLDRRDRVAAIRARLAESGVLRELDARAPEPCTRADLELVHDARYVESMVAAAPRAPLPLDPDTMLAPGTLRAAELGVGAALEAVERVQRGEWRNAFVACRPPGHHAERAAAMGFCLFNSIAIAARALRDRHGVERVAILDFDVHHGNGTQHAFESDPTVFYASLHQFPLFPGTGAASERGVGAGAGFTLNCPQPFGAGERDWLLALEQSVLPALDKFRPQFLLLAAGFDGHEADPVAQQLLTTESYRKITRLCTALARERCHGRIVSLLEGGYDLAALAASAQVHVEELLRA